MLLTAFFFPSLPVLLAAVMALPVFALTALFPCHARRILTTKGHCK